MDIKTVILARGGSKGIHKKNIIQINNKPLIYYTINTAQNSKANNVWVSTNDAEIINVANECGANIIYRPNNISNDKSKSEEALMHFAHNMLFDILVFIQPTSPLLAVEDINNGLKMIGTYDSIFTGYKEHWVPRWTIDLKPDQWDINNRPMRQDMEEKYVENGAMYITTREALLSSKCRYSGNIGILEMPPSRSFQIDNYEDLELVKKLL